MDLSVESKRWQLAIRPSTLRLTSKMLAARTRAASTLSRSIRPATGSFQAVRALSSTVATPSSLLASQRRVDAQQQKASDELGDIMAKRWLGSAMAAGTDTDRVSFPLLSSETNPLELTLRNSPPLTLTSAEQIIVYFIGDDHSIALLSCFPS